MLVGKKGFAGNTRAESEKVFGQLAAGLVIFYELPNYNPDGRCGRNHTRSISRNQAFETDFIGIADFVPVRNTRNHYGNGKQGKQRLKNVFHV
jgi:hypothetical protein